MPGSVDSRLLSLPSFSAADSSTDGSIPSQTHPSLSSGDSDEEDSTEGRTPHHSDTSFGLSSLESVVEYINDCVKLRPADEDYLAGARAFIASQPVFRKKLKIRVSRRMQVVVRSRQGYTQLRRELRRRQPRPAYSVVSEGPSLAATFAQLSLRPERTFKKNESAV